MTATRPLQQLQALTAQPRQRYAWLLHKNATGKANAKPGDARDVPSRRLGSREGAICGAAAVHIPRNRLQCTTLFDYMPPRRAAL